MNIKKALMSIKKEEWDDISDIIIRTSSPFFAVRQNGEWRRLEVGDINLTVDNILGFFEENTTDKLYQKINKRIFDFHCLIETAGGRRRGRGSVMHFGDKRDMAVVVRIIPEEVPKLDEIGFFEEPVGNHPGGDITQIRQWLSCEKAGLVLITGATGSGKTTTMSALINDININQKKNIITFENPIEIIHESKESIVSQQSIPSDENSFACALRNTLRRAPDVIVIGEINNPETAIETLIAAETGHLVLATLHTHSAIETMDRIIALLPKERREWSQDVLANALLGIISQTLLPSNGKRVLHYEMLVVDNMIRHAIKTHDIARINNLMYDTRQQPRSSRPAKFIYEVLADAGAINEVADKTT
ncbi:MAG: type IV pilus twitching motility protein PilT [Gammaproteobacteria bacterium WSBS_2016_MAG_OTU1]